MGGGDYNNEEFSKDPYFEAKSILYKINILIFKGHIREVVREMSAI